MLSFKVCLFTCCINHQSSSRMMVKLLDQLCTRFVQMRYEFLTCMISFFCHFRDPNGDFFLFNCFSNIDKKLFGQTCTKKSEKKVWGLFWLHIWCQLLRQCQSACQKIRHVARRAQISIWTHKRGTGRCLPPCLASVYLAMHFEHLASTQCYSSRSMCSNLAMLRNKGSGDTMVRVIRGIPAFQWRPLCLLFFCAVMKTVHAGRKLTGPSLCVFVMMWM